MDYRLLKCVLAAMLVPVVLGTLTVFTHCRLSLCRLLINFLVQVKRIMVPLDCGVQVPPHCLTARGEYSLCTTVGGEIFVMSLEALI